MSSAAVVRPTGTPLTQSVGCTDVFGDSREAETPSVVTGAITSHNPLISLTREHHISLLVWKYVFERCMRSIAAAPWCTHSTDGCYR